MRNAVFVLAVGLLGGVRLLASFVATTSSATFESLVKITQTENYGTQTNGHLISSNNVIDGLTYNAFVLTQVATQLDITNTFNSVSGLSLGADHVQGFGRTDFLNGEGATITFASPVTAFGMFFNVNLNSGSFGFTSSAGSATTGSAAYDSSSFVFAGLISTVPFSSISFISTGPLATYTVPELLLGTTTPEPSTLAITMTGIALLALGALKRRYF